MKQVIVFSVFAWLMVFQGNIVWSQKVYDFNSTCQQAYQEITSLKIQSGERLLEAARKQNPDNLIPDLLEGYIDFFVLFFNEDPAEYEKRKPGFEERIKKLDMGPQASPYYNYCRAVFYLQKATIAIKFGERWRAGWDFRKAFAIIKQNRKNFPDFLPDDMIYAPMQVIVGVIPDGYKWMAGLLGMRGSIKDGMKMMQDFVSSKDENARFFFNEAAFYYCYLLFYIQNQPEKVFQFIKDEKLDVVNNHLFAYLSANLGINYKRTEFAKKIILNKNNSPDYLSTPVWDYEMAFIKLHHLELNEAARYFEKFLNTFKGRFYVKDSYQKLSWCYYLMGNMDAAENARQKLLKRGSTDTDADKQASRDAKNNTWPNALLLKARLLSDGGYHHEALALLNGKNTSDFSSPADKLEFSYRVARIYDDLDRFSDAIQAYQATIHIGKSSKEYYASRAALQIGYIYEKQGKNAKAIEYYKKCIEMKDHDFKDSIDQKAKAGIARCEGK